MVAARTFTADELNRARAMRLVDNASWRAIGRALGCNEDTIRCALDPDYQRKRHAALVAKQRDLDNAAKARRTATEAKSAKAYDANGMDFA